MTDKIYIFDTTLRDGAQTQGVDFSLDDKEKILPVKIPKVYKRKFSYYFFFL